MNFPSSSEADDLLQPCHAMIDLLIARDGPIQSDGLEIRRFEKSLPDAPCGPRSTAVLAGKSSLSVSTP